VRAGCQTAQRTDLDAPPPRSASWQCPGWVKTALGDSVPDLESAARKLCVIWLTHEHVSDIARQCLGEKARPRLSLQRSSTRATATKDLRTAIPLFDRDESAQLAQDSDHVYPFRESDKKVKYTIDLLDKPGMMVVRCRPLVAAG
jgi:hypothetical protein